MNLEATARTQPTDRRFGFTFATLFAIAGGYAGWKSRLPTALLFAVMAALFVGLAFVAPATLGPLNRAWMWLARQLNRVVSPIVLGIVFLVVLTPVAFVLRLAGRDALRLRRSARERTYWVSRVPPGPPPTSLTNQF